ncbi:MAG TPA: cyclic 2,3-diphosphoglycerate synthase [Candidatus Limnocylindria bacterium]|jgi:predicted GTPase|nr:cyclic 2,3-diphosphoglycerate synthase [Candidatus Limnocylindria bacterium]
MSQRRIVIMGAAGRDFHDFNVVFRDDASARVVAFTATQIPGIADRRYPAELAGRHYPNGIPICGEDELEDLVRSERVDEVVFAYSDVSHETVMHAASRAMAAGADFRLLGPASTMIESRLPVVAIGAVRTGSGKSQTTRYLAELIAQAGLTPVVIRHPMPYGDLAAQRVQRYASLDDLERHHTTIEEREEYEPHLEAGRVLYAGVDYEAILRQAEHEADVIVWDGGNNDFPFYRPDLFVVVADPLRAGHEQRFHPGETNVRMADVVVINKVDSVDDATLRDEVASIRSLNADAQIVTARSTLRLEGGEIRGRRVVVVEDGPTLTHGGMTFGAGIAAARRFGVAEILDPRPYAVGSIRQVLEKYPSLDRLVPAMGYGEEQMAELAATLNATDADLVLAGTPIDLTRVLRLDKPVVRVRYDLQEVGGPPLRDLLAPVLAGTTPRVPA